MDRSINGASYRTGTLPHEAPLAVAYVPMQRAAEPSYESIDALSQGTLFPGLDLPFLNVLNKTLAETPLTELMAIDFVVDELELYLDTHSDDTEAFQMYQTWSLYRQLLQYQELPVQQERREELQRVRPNVQDL